MRKEKIYTYTSEELKVHERAAYVKGRVDERKQWFEFLGKLTELYLKYAKQSERKKNKQ